MRPPFLLILAALTPLFAANPVLDRVDYKLNLIDSGRARRGSTIVFTPAEMNTWARSRVPQVYQGIRDPSILLGMGAATGSATIDFLKMRQAEGVATNPLIAKLIEGERPLKVSVQLESSGGRATAKLTRLEISGIAVTGAPLDFLVNQFFLKLFPDAKVNQPFDLRDNIDRIQLRPDGVRVTIKK
jgi:hypothetical protein